MPSTESSAPFTIDDLREFAATTVDSPYHTARHVVSTAVHQVRCEYGDLHAAVAELREAAERDETELDVELRPVFQAAAELLEMFAASR
jgi:hypothetical protein